jgi:hypothetical protein
MSTTVQVIDISLNGVLLSSPVVVDVGSHAQLRTVLGTEVFEAQVLIRRSAPEAGAQPRVRLGGQFVALEEHHRQAIERFLQSSRF